MASSIFLQPGFFSIVGGTAVLAGGITIPIANKYGFAGVANGMDLTATATVLRPPDGGQYFYVSNGVVSINSATLSMGVGTAALVVFGVPTSTGLGTLLNGDQSAGIGFDLTTDALLKIRTRAQTGYATVDCLGLKASGVAGASFGPSAVASITVVNGIITAIS